MVGSNHAYIKESIMKIRQLAIHPQMAKRIKDEGSLWIKAFISNNDLSILYTLDPTHHGNLHHMSISRADRYPDWDDIVQAKQEIMGDIDTMMIIPKKEDYVNVMNYCFHVWETPVEWNVR